MIWEHDERGECVARYDGDEIAAILRALPEMAIEQLRASCAGVGDSMKVNGKPLSPKRRLSLWTLSVVRELELAANIYLSALQIAPSREEVKSIGAKRAQLLEQIGAVEAAASKLRRPALVDELAALRNLVNRSTWWEEMEDGRKKKHRKALVRRIAKVWAHALGINLSEVQISTVDNSPMLSFIGRTMEPILQLSCQKAESDTLVNIVREIKAECGEGRT